MYSSQGRGGHFICRVGWRCVGERLGGMRQYIAAVCASNLSEGVGHQSVAAMALGWPLGVSVGSKHIPVVSLQQQAVRLWFLPGPPGVSSAKLGFKMGEEVGGFGVERGHEGRKVKMGAWPMCISAWGGGMSARSCCEPATTGSPSAVAAADGGGVSSAKLRCCLLYTSRRG